MLAHSLRPHTLEGHMAIYKRVLHHTGNTVPKWLLECLGVYTSLHNRCSYCVEHHFSGLCRLLGDSERADVIRRALESDNFVDVFDAKETGALLYAGKLTNSPMSVEEKDAEQLRQLGWDDGEILEINQVVAYFAYANRTVLGLGINAKGDILGLSPRNSQDEEDWTHR
jgi:uncharacterized peroxidase-related enzyme